MRVYRLREAADLLGLSDDTLRRWADNGRVELTLDDDGVRGISGEALAALAGTMSSPEAVPVTGPASARNRFRGIVTKVTRDTVMAQVELQCGPHRVVSLMSREAADDLALVPGTVAVASVKATTVVVELPADR